VNRLEAVGSKSAQKRGESLSNCGAESTKVFPVMQILLTEVAEPAYHGLNYPEERSELV
jgi:hypothetical protein